jgi:hypothetical protein
MIFESYPYRRDLLKQTKIIRSFFKKSGIIRSEKRLYEIDKYLFTSAFLVRKLIDSKKISDELEAEKFEVQYSEVTDSDATRDFLARDRFYENYDVENRKDTAIGLVDLTNLFIHSHIMTLSFNPIKTKDNTEKWEIIVTSDWKRERIYFIRLSDYLKICKKTCKDRIIYMTMGFRNPADEFKVILVKSRVRRR